MIVAVNTRLLIRNKLDGIGWFCFETMSRIAKNHPEHSFVFIFDRPYDPAFVFSENIIPVVVGPQARHPFLFILWFEWSVSRVLKQYKADVFVSPDGFLSLSSKVPSLAVIHDINFFHRPKDVPWLVRKYYNYFFPRFARKAKGIATVSSYSKKDISHAYDINPDKIDIVYNGANLIYKPIGEDEKEKVKQLYAGGKKYFVFVGTLHPRKNIARLITAFDSFKRDNPQHDFALVIVGNKMFLTSDIERALLQSTNQNDIYFTGRLEPSELARVMAAAYALTFVPLFEGFGIPIVEAMYCDVPVICSNVTSMPEVAGDAAVYADPYNITSIVDAMYAVAESKALHDDLITKGRMQRIRYTWDRTALHLWESIQKIR